MKYLKTSNGNKLNKTLPNGTEVPVKAEYQTKHTALTWNKLQK